MAYETEYNQIIDALAKANTSLSNISNPEIRNLISRIQGDLTGHINFLNIQLGNNVVGESPVVKSVGGRPLKRMLGKDFSDIQNKVAAPVLDNDKLTFKEFQARQKQSSQDAEVAAFKARLEELYPQFSAMENEVILDQLNEVEIRGIAKWAGLPVSDFSPKEIDSKFVDQIKAAIKTKEELDAQNEPKIQL